MTCPSCLTECGGERKERRIRINEKCGYPVHDCCEREAARLQVAEDLKRAGVRQERVAGLRRLSGIPAKFAEVDFTEYKADLRNGLALKTTVNFAAEFPSKSVLIIGPIGTGKTMLGCAALNHIMLNKARECRYVYTPDLFDCLREGFGFIDAPATDLQRLRVQEVCRIACIFLDDPGVSKDSEWTQGVYQQIIDARYREHRPTFMASNVGMAGLQEILGKRSMSRICESYTIVEVNGKDHRLA